MSTAILIGAAHAHTDDHLASLRARGWHLAGVIDHDSERAGEVAARTGAAVLQAPGDVAADVALVCSETARHEADVAAALAAGLHVFCEKPLAADAAAAGRLAEAAARLDRRLETGFFLRQDPGLAQMRRQVRDGAIGTVHEARARFSHGGAFAEWLDLDGWMTDPKAAIYGGFGDEAVHVLDWLLWTLGPVAEAQAMFGRAAGWPVDDHGAALLRMRSGAIAQVAGGWTDATMRMELDLVGRDGAAAARNGPAGGHATICRRGAADPAWRADLAPLDAGQGSAAFLDGLADGRWRGADPYAAVAVNALLDRLYA